MLVPQEVPCQYHVSPAEGVIVFNVVDAQAGLLAGVGAGGSAGNVFTVTATLPQLADQHPPKESERT